MKKIMNVTVKVFAVLGVATLIWCFMSIIRLMMAGCLTMETLKYMLLALVLLPACPFGWSASLMWAEKEMEKEEEES